MLIVTPGVRRDRVLRSEQPDFLLLCQTNSDALNLPASNPAATVAALRHLHNALQQPLAGEGTLRRVVAACRKSAMKQPSHVMFHETARGKPHAVK
jgi:hypothetical protein